MTRRINEPAVNPSEPADSEKVTKAVEARLKFDRFDSGATAEAWVSAENALNEQEFTQYLAAYRKAKTTAHLAAYQESKGTK